MRKSKFWKKAWKSINADPICAVSQVAVPHHFLPVFHTFSMVFKWFTILFFSLNLSIPSHRIRRASMCLGANREAKSNSHEAYSPSRRRLISINEINTESIQKPCKSMPNPWKTFSLFFNRFLLILLVFQWSFADLRFSAKTTRLILNYNSTPLFPTRRGGTERWASESAIDPVAVIQGHLQKATICLDSRVFPSDYLFELLYFVWTLEFFCGYHCFLQVFWCWNEKIERSKKLWKSTNPDPFPAVSQFAVSHCFLACFS